MHRWNDITERWEKAPRSLIVIKPWRPPAKDGSYMAWATVIKHGKRVQRAELLRE